LPAVGVPRIVNVLVKVSVEPAAALASVRVSPQIHVAPGIIAVHAELIGLTATESCPPSCVVWSLGTVRVQEPASAEVTAGNNPREIDATMENITRDESIFFIKKIVDLLNNQQTWTFNKTL
jgi:hypothetical protein